MALVKRISRLFGADLNAVLNRLEDPEALLALAIQEMEEALQGERKSVALLRHERDTIRSRSERLAANNSEIDAQLDVCFEAADEQLAKSMTRRKLQCAKLLENLAGKLHDTEAALSERMARLEQNEVRLAEMRQQAELVSGEENRGGGQFDDAIEFVVTADDVEVAYLREKRQRSGS